jgi:hypothetical protein
MKVNVDAPRVLHLLVLTSLTAALGQLLVYYFDWGFLAAVGLSCSVVVQLSNVVLDKYGATNTAADTAASSSSSSKSIIANEPNKKKGTGNPKKKKQT